MLLLALERRAGTIEALSGRNPQNHQGSSTSKNSTLVPAISTSFPGMQLINNYQRLLVA